MRRATVYEIRVKGHLGREWAAWFAPLIIQHQADGSSCLSGPVRDQAELHGVLTKLCHLNLPLLALNQVEPTRTQDTFTGSDSSNAQIGS